LWTGLTKQKPEVLLEALVRSFWCGHFERDVHMIALEHGDSPHGNTAITVDEMPTSSSPVRAPGNYAVRHDGVVVKIGQDDRSRPTADRVVRPVYRDTVARGPDIPDWEGCYETGAANALVPESAFRDFSSYDLSQWSPTTINHRYKRWRIRRSAFVDWYARWNYAPLADVNQFWPSAPNTPSEEPSDTHTQQPTSKRRRGRPEAYNWAALMEPLTQYVEEHGIFPSQTDLAKWCIENVKLNRSVRRPKGESPDLKNAGCAVKKHGLDKVGLREPG
jgi:hypothetical protein